jgi:hypothetical protein
MNDIKVHFIIPTINKEAMMTKFLTSLGEFDEVRDLVSFGICFQKYDKKDIDKVVKEFKKHKLTLFYIEKEYTFKQGWIPLIKMRDDCAMLNPTAPYYCFVDDDSHFDNKTPYAISDVIKSAIEYFNLYPKCGAIMATKNQQSGVIRPNIINLPICTNLALFIRNIYEGGHILPIDKVSLVGMSEDIISVRQRTMDGYFDSLCFTDCGYHADLKDNKEAGKYRYHWLDIKMEEGTTLYALYHEYWNKQFDFHKMRFDKTLPVDYIVPKRK